MSGPITTPQQLRDSYRRLADRVATAALRAGRRPSDVHLVAVTKTATPDQLRLLVELGHQDFGENRVQHLVQRVASLEEFVARRRLLGEDGFESRVSSFEKKKPPAPRAKGTGPERPRPSAFGNSKPETRNPKPPSVRWHMIGHLQRNKVKLVVPLVQLIHSVDSLRLAEELHAYGGRTDRIIDVLLQVNAAGDPAKYGVAPAAALHLAEQIDTMVHLRLRGLMTIAPYSENPEHSRPAFAQLHELFEEIQAAKIGGPTLNLLSMGMSGDFEVAIAEGANLLRIGRALFGEGPEPADGEGHEHDRRESEGGEDEPL